VRVLVTGSQGYLGSVLTPDLTRRGHDVVGLDAGWYADGVFGPAAREVVSWRGDIRDLRSEDLAGFDAVVHLAGLSNDPLGDLAPETTWEINHKATRALAHHAASAGVGRFVFLSSCSVYGATDNARVDEAAPLDPLTTYAKSKIAAETDLIGLADDDFAPVILRCATLFGRSPRMRFDLVINDLAASAFTTGRVVVHSDGMAFRPVLHVHDAAAVIAAALDADRERIHGRIVNVGIAGENYRVRDLADRVSVVFGGCPVDVRGELHDGRTYSVSFNLLAELLPRFSCSWDVERGVHDLRRRFEEIGLSEDGYRSNAFQRVARVRELLRARHLDDRLFWKTAPEGRPRPQVA